MSLQIRRLSYALGAEILGVDIRKPIDDQCLSEIRTAFLDHNILLFRGQSLTSEQHIAFSRQFGELYKTEALANKHPQYPEIFLNKPEPNWGPSDYVGEYWHTDLPYTLVPAMASILHGVSIPDVGGDTLFSNMYLAYDTLSDGMKKLIAGLHGIHPGGARRIDNSTAERLSETKRLNPAVAQPLAREHPETGRKALYLTERVKQIVGMTQEESKPLLEFLCQHATRPQFVYRHRWQKDDLLMWDNRCMMHNALGDYDRRQIRHMERTTVKGTPAGYAYGGPLQ